MKVKILEHTPNPERVVAKAAKLCYSPVGVDEIESGLTEESVGKFVKMLSDIGHLSPLEHISFTFAIEDVSRITEIQLVRHRIASYSIQSGRYVNRNSPDFIIPPRVKENKLALEVYEKIINESIGAYNDIFLILMLDKMGYSTEQVENMNMDNRIDLVADFSSDNEKEYSKFEKECIQDARYVHLQSLSTKIITTMNARTLLHFFNHRCCNRAQWEIRSMANEMLRQVKDICPNIFDNAGAPCESGKCPEGKMSCGNPIKR